MDFKNYRKDNNSILGKYQELTEILQQQNKQMLDAIKKENVDNLFIPEIKPVIDYSTIENEDKSTASFMTGEQYGNIYMYNRYLKHVLQRLGKDIEGANEGSDTFAAKTSDDMQNIINRSLGLK